METETGGEVSNPGAGGALSKETIGMLDIDGKLVGFSFPLIVGLPVFFNTGITVALEMGVEVVSADIVGLVVVGVITSEFGLRVGLDVARSAVVGFNEADVDAMGETVV